MTDEEHDLWEALAVGHAMRALEPADDAQFRAHLATCDRCAQVLAESEDLVESLASAVEPMEPPASLRERVLAISRDSGARVAPVVTDDLAKRRAMRNAVSPMARWIAAAAVVSAIASAAVTYGVVHEEHRINTASPGYICLTDPDCQHMPLVNGSKVIGAVVLDKDTGKAYIMSPELPKNSDNDQYVVWTGDASGKMTALTAFRVTSGGAFNALDRVPSLGGVAAMAISLERRGPLPDKPSTPLGIATVPTA
jgi:anti-sigma-K factor RskA